MDYLAWAYHLADESKKAISLYEETVNKRVEVLGDDHPHTLFSMQNLAVVHKKAGNLKKAI